MKHTQVYGLRYEGQQHLSMTTNLLTRLVYKVYDQSMLVSDALAMYHKDLNDEE